MLIARYIQRHTSAAPLAFFRVAFGLMMALSVVRFWSKGWIEELYVLPRFHFSYFGFEFIQPLGSYTYLLFLVCGLSAVGVAIGFWYRASSILLFLSFTYIELIEKSTYLNHYYFISLACLLMTLVPAHAYFSVDSYRRGESAQVPQWSVDAIKLLVAILYFYAGIAKINSDWLLEAQPLRIWLAAKNDLPLIGWLFNYTAVAYAFSWIGCIYDLTIPFLLWNNRTRIWAYLAVVVFHGLTAILFPIGMFPWIMIVTGLIFFSADFHEKIIATLRRWIQPHWIKGEGIYVVKKQKLIVSLLAFFFAFQILFPFRYMAYPDELFWTEEGYRFSWRVMLMEKAGMATFTVLDPSGKAAVVDNKDFLTPLQEKMMSTQPDMILQYAHFLRDEYASRGFEEPEVYVDSYVTLNGRLGKSLIDPACNLAAVEDSFAHKSWILSFGDEIKGL